ncbi:hypothetical protein FB45DRAFT_943174 [Roridomyces roridus]|uniref:Uncharacterized protein n=1 Tax=Roridomyces roridus TaxID=1738132 RepID=A0AAD7F946_9AGAR|nr:hypothetical protein FB45DRAFT_943174 [Roridomyces roridus]
MLASLSIAATLLLSVSTAMGKAHQSRPRHPFLASRVGDANFNSTAALELEKRGTFSGPTTWYETDTGPDACTGKNHKDSDWFVAMNPAQFAGGSGCCGKQLDLSYNGKTTTVTCVDECAGGPCTAYGGLDLTAGLFTFLAGSTDVGEFTGTWSYSGSGSSSSSSDDGDDDDDKQTTTSTKHTTSTTSTKHTTSTTTTTHTSTSSTTSTTTTSTTSTSAIPSSKATSASSSAPSSAAPSSAQPSATPSGATGAIKTPVGPENVMQFNEAVMQLLNVVVQAAHQD